MAFWNRICGVNRTRGFEVTLFLGATVTASVICLFAVWPWLLGGIHDALELWQAWQTLIAGLLALLASLVGLIAATASQRELRLRVARSERAMLPFRLSSLCAIIHQNGKSLQVLSAAIEDGQTGTFSEWFPIPNELIEGFRKNIEQSPTRVAEKLSQLLAIVQVLQSRGLASIDAAPMTAELGVYELRTLAIPLAEAHALGVSMFGYAKGDDENLIEPVTDSLIQNSLRQFGFWPEDDVVIEKLTLGAIVSSRYAKGELLTQQIGGLSGEAS